MFGHQNDDSTQPANDGQGDLIEEAVSAEAIETDRPSGEPAAAAVQTDTSTPGTETPDPTAPTQTPSTPSDTITPEPAQASPTTAPTTDSSDWQHPDAPPADDGQTGAQPDQPEADKGQISDVISPAGGFPKRPTFQDRPDTPPPTEADDTLNAILKPKDDSVDAATSELIDIRQKAVSELAPIIDKLDLPPLEKFRTIMMIIQVSDDEALVKAAYTAAHAIDDEKEKAQALLDIVNEVNYFTHQEPDK